MADCDVGTRPRSSKSYPTDGHPDEVDPQDCPELYASVCRGDCLNPAFTDGDCLVFSTTASVEPGDYVGFWLDPTRVEPGELPRRVKRLRSIMPGQTFPYRLGAACAVIPIVELEQFNPPRLYRVPADHILAMHKVIGKAVPNTNGTEAVIPREMIERETHR